jgi:hypothetical protein
VTASRWPELDGYSTEQGPTFDGGHFIGGGPRRGRALAVRLLTPQGRTPSVDLDLTDGATHGCSVSLPPATAREVAAALVEAADRADAEVRRWQGIHADLVARLEQARIRDAALRAGERQ